MALSVPRIPLPSRVDRRAMLRLPSVLFDLLRCGALRSDVVVAVEEIEYDRTARVGMVFFRKWKSAEMESLVRLFVEIDPAVRAIYTFRVADAVSDDYVPGPAYTRSNGNQWVGASRCAIPSAITPAQ